MSMDMMMENIEMFLRRRRRRIVHQMTYLSVNRHYSFIHDLPDISTYPDPVPEEQEQEEDLP